MRRTTSVVISLAIPTIAVLALVDATLAPAPAADRCSQAVGTWTAPDRHAVAAADGSVVLSGPAYGTPRRGRWRCIDPHTGTVEMSWAGGLAKTKVVMGGDRNTSISTNMLGQSFTWQRVGGRPVAAAKAKAASNRRVATPSARKASAAGTEPALRGLSSVGGPSEPMSVKRSGTRTGTPR